MSDRQDLIETACHNACQAMHRESERAHREQRSPEACLILAAALNHAGHRDAAGWLLGQLTAEVIQLRPERGGAA
jgi:hypothetical protein